MYKEAFFCTPVWINVPHTLREKEERERERAGHKYGKFTFMFVSEIPFRLSSPKVAALKSSNVREDAKAIWI